MRVFFDAEDAAAVLATARQALATVVERVRSWPEDAGAWRELLPADFVARCEPEKPHPDRDADPEAIVRWETWWHALTPEEKRAAGEGPWRLSDWLYYFDPTDDGQGDDRSWWWWDAGTDTPGTGWIEVATTGWPFGTGSLYWLIEASGGQNPHS